MDTCASTVSPALMAANRRLQALKAQARKVRLEAPAREVLPWQDVSCPPAANLHGACAQLSSLPAHLGWGSEPLTQLLRRQSAACEQEVVASDWHGALTQEAGCEPAGADTDTADDDLEAPRPTWVKHYPDIGLAMLRQEQTASGRLWILLRYMDEAGQGSLRIANLASTLTSKSSPFYLCGKRQLRNLLRDGKGIYWTRDKEWLWLRSAARVAFALGVERLANRPVALPVAGLLDGIGTFRAHLYVAFHSSRTKETPQGTRAMPISRESLAELSGVGASSQRTYEAQTATAVQENFAIGEPVTKEAYENRAWQKGTALFELKDYRGHQGKKGKTYLAWQLPNTYLGDHLHRPKGRQKRINRKLNDLVMKGMPGNNELSSDTQMPRKVYFPDGKLAARAYGRDPNQAHFWRRYRTKNKRFELWQQLGEAG